MFRDERHSAFKKALEEMTVGAGPCTTAEDPGPVAAALVPILVKAYEQVKLPLRDRVEGRTKKDIYLSSLRTVGTKFGGSWTAKLALKALGMDKVLQAGEIYADRLQQFSRLGIWLEEYENKYDQHMDHALSVAESFHHQEEDGPCKLYASLKTWKDDAEVARTGDLITRYGLAKHELILEGPVKLFLQVGEEGFFLLWRALMWDGTRDEPAARDIRVLSDDLYALVQHQDEAGLIREVSDLMAALFRRQGEIWTKRQRQLRLMVPDSGRDYFLAGFEAGKYFTA
jgi:hypothetical protein